MEAFYILKNREQLSIFFKHVSKQLSFTHSHSSETSYQALLLLP